MSYIGIHSCTCYRLQYMDQHSTDKRTQYTCCRGENTASPGPGMTHTGLVTSRTPRCSADRTGRLLGAVRQQRGGQSPASRSHATHERSARPSGRAPIRARPARGRRQSQSGRAKTGRAERSVRAQTENWRNSNASALGRLFLHCVST